MEFCLSARGNQNNVIGMMHLLSSYCKPLVLYGTECTCLSNESLFHTQKYSKNKAALFFATLLSVK